MELKRSIDLFRHRVKEGFDGFHSVIDKIPQGRDYDLIIAHEVYRSGLAALKLSEFYTKPYLILDVVEYPVFSQRTSRSLREMGLKSKISDTLTTDYAVSLAKCFDHYFATSVGQAQFYKNKGCTVSYDLLRNCRNFCSVESDTNYLRERFKLSNNDIIIIYPNKVYIDCGIDIALEALCGLDFRFKLVVLGEVVPDMEKQVHELVAMYGLENRFFVTGMLDPSMVLSIIGEADISLVLLEPTVENHKTALPNRLFDCVMAGVPVISITETEVGNLVLAYSLGEVISLPYPESLIQAIDSLIKRMQYYKANVNKARRIFNWENEQVRIHEVLLKNVPHGSQCLFLALKDISRNDRVRRITESLLEFGYKVDLVALNEPLESLKVSDINYITIRG